jgi:hypothetical protein
MSKKYCLKQWSFYFWGTIVICIILIIVNIALLQYRSDANPVTEETVMFSFSLLLLILLGKKLLAIICIDDTGVSISYLKKTFGYLPWSEIQEVGIGIGPRQIWIYFSRSTLDNKQTRNLQMITDSNHFIKLKYNKNALAIVREFYHGEIRNSNMVP